VKRLLLLLAALAPLIASADDVTSTIARVKRSVVAVGTFERTRSPQFAYLGTGFAIDDGTLVVTNAHVIPASGPATEQIGILVPNVAGDSGTFREAKVIATDLNADLSVMKISGVPLPALRIADSSTAKEGQSVLVTGFPIGAALGPFASTHRGMIAAIAPIATPQPTAGSLDPKVVRRISRGAFDIFQLDAVAYPGSSGSPVYDPTSGDVLAVVNMVFVRGTREAALTQPSGITYAVPSRHIQELLARPR
jgi:S1-C subfamily serine protease